MNYRSGLRWGSFFAIFATLLIGCQSNTTKPVASTAVPFTIRSGSENQDLQPILDEFGARHGIAVQVTYSGSLAISQSLSENNVREDAVWPASSLWLHYAGNQINAHDSESISRTPVVLGIKKSRAQELGWIGKPVHVADILAAARAGKIRYMMTSATQSNSGASAYLSYLYAFAGHPQMLMPSDLTKPSVKANIKAILGTVNRSSGSSGFLQDLFLNHYDEYDGMINYEVLLIQTNQKLVASGREPLYAIYPVDGVAVADSPLAYVDHGDPSKKKLFFDLKSYLESPAIQARIAASGRRTGKIGLSQPNADPAVFNPDWGIDTKRTLSPIRFPEPRTVQVALDLYQSAFRKPSVTVYCLDFSGSMATNGGEGQLKAAMERLLDQAEARKQLLQAAPDDRTIVVTFSSHVSNVWQVVGNDPTKLRKISDAINRQSAEGGTNFYGALRESFAILGQIPDLERYSPAIVLMTDGEDTGGQEGNYYLAREKLPANLRYVPVYGILFGDASRDQLDRIALESSGKVFDGRLALMDTFREVKGYN